MLSRKASLANGFGLIGSVRAAFAHIASWRSRTSRFGSNWKGALAAATLTVVDRIFLGRAVQVLEELAEFPAGGAA